jgi:hypothetical protein
MALEDYVPNIFGGTPTVYQGLLSPQEQASLEKRSNLAGLLGFGAALAQGMSGGGYPRSALQNILSAAAQGFAGAGQTYQAGIGQLAEVQKLQQSRAQINAINQLLQDPRVANDPMMQAYIRANPAEAIKYFAEMAPIREAISPTPSLISPIAPMAAPAPQPAPQPQVPFMRGADSQEMPEFSGQPETYPIPMEGVEPQEVQETNVLPEVVVQAQAPKVDPLVARRDALIAENERLSRIPTKLAQDRIEGNIKQIDTLDKQLSRRAVQDFDFSVIKDTIPPQFKGEVDKLEQLAVTGAITGNELRQGLQDLNKRAMEFVTKKTDYTNQDRRVAAGMFQGRPIEELNPAELMQLENKLFELEIAKRKAGATVIDMGSREMEKEFAKGVVEDTRASFQQAKSAVNTVKTIQSIQPLLDKGVYSGFQAGAPRAVDQFATALGVSGKNTQEKLANTAVAMQRLASLELSAAEAMKGQGAITENERSLIARAAAGNLRDFTDVEVRSLLSSLEKIAQQKIASHQQNYEIMSNDPIGSKYSKYYKIEAPAAPTKKYNPATGRIE